MARKLSIVVLCIVQMLLLLVENDAEIVVSTVEAPAPQPHKNTTHTLSSAPAPLPHTNTTKSHVPNLQHGITEGSLKPQGNTNNSFHHTFTTYINLQHFFLFFSFVLFVC
uniref:Uncharacterized protein n=1 Tax=Glycine max TaxID=3847 RepID=K7KER5_SOYBN